MIADIICIFNKDLKNKKNKNKKKLNETKLKLHKTTNNKMKKWYEKKIMSQFETEQQATKRVSLWRL